jgi:hypothetical protein
MRFLAHFGDFESLMNHKRAGLRGVFALSAVHVLNEKSAHDYQKYAVR